MKLNITNLGVFYNSIKVGMLKNENNQIYFQYDSNWVKTGFSISPLSLPLSDRVYKHQNTSQEIYGVFLDSLPDGWGELLITRYLKTKGINYSSLPILDKLSLVNNLSKGALTYVPANSNDNVINNINLDDLAIKFAKIYDDNDDYLDEAYQLGGSSGGASPKAYLKIDNQEWLVKFPSSIDPKDIGVEEYKYNMLAKECGIDVNEFKLFSSNINKGYFGAKRFDRNNGKKIHMISLSNLLETSYRIPNLSYELLFQVSRKISNSEDELYEIYNRMCFNVLISNKDDHGHNFAFIYDDIRKVYRLSPFYDITSTPNKLEHEMTLLNKGNPNIDDLKEIIGVIGLDKEKYMNILNNIIKTLKSNK